MWQRGVECVIDMPAQGPKETTPEIDAETVIDASRDSGPVLSFAYMVALSEAKAVAANYRDERELEADGDDD
ncbi:MAG: hypothetical protein UX37_C0013G0008 [Microgenomates group bacterium GW2011_GWA2_46_16]|nr:MAG: hypothetical protein UX37_C0013G0008 [Microgenomates group bacterium GW2011_GWA2_46_16]